MTGTILAIPSDMAFSSSRMKPASIRFRISAVTCSSSSTRMRRGACFTGIASSLILSLCTATYGSSPGISLEFHAKQ